MSSGSLTGEHAAGRGSPEEARLVERLRAGDERAFAAVVEEWSPGMLRLARVYVSSRAMAEEVVQETWLGVIRGLDRFEGRSSLKTWAFRILTNTAKTRAQREGRSVPFSAFASIGDEAGEPSVEPERFYDASDPNWPHHWISSPRRWAEIPEERLVSDETRKVIEEAIAELPPAQREVITLRDVDGFSSEEVCSLLEISEGNQRVILHRARSKVRRALERYLDEL